MLLNALNIKKEYRIQAALDIEKLEIRDRDRIGLIGRDGAGRSIPLGVLSGRITCDKGVVKRYCPTVEILQTSETEDEPEARFLSQLKLRGSVVKSGGERTRCAIGATLSSRVPLLFAGEPITNLDMEGVELLEKMMKGHRGATLMMSHDRTPLDQVCSQIWELDRTAVRVLDDNYSDWASQRGRERGSQEFEHQQYQKEKGRLERVADALQRRGQKMVKLPKRMGSSEWMFYEGVTASQQGHMQSNKSSVMSRLEHSSKGGRLDRPSQASMRLSDTGRVRAKSAAAIQHLTVSYGNRIVLGDVSLKIEAGKRTLIAGNNGARKPTLVKTLADRAPETFIASEARVAYFSQNLDTLDPGRAILENVTEDTACPQYICRAVLANLYMIKDGMFKPASVLSGGEEIKITPARALISGRSFMILDEPTNHMGVHIMGGLEHLLGSYDGTLLAVSHDRTFTSHTGDVVYQLEKGDMRKSTAQKVDIQYSGEY